MASSSRAGEPASLGAAGASRTLRCHPVRDDLRLYVGCDGGDDQAVDASVRVAPLRGLRTPRNSPRVHEQPARARYSKASASQPCVPIAHASALLGD
jgi:hypothetical protein